jgi:hypothetical protein
LSDAEADEELVRSLRGRPILAAYKKVSVLCWDFAVEVTGFETCDPSSEAMRLQRLTRGSTEIPRRHLGQHEAPKMARFCPPLLLLAECLPFPAKRESRLDVK